MTDFSVETALNTACGKTSLKNNKGHGAVVVIFGPS